MKCHTCSELKSDKNWPHDKCLKHRLRQDWGRGNYISKEYDFIDLQTHSKPTRITSKKQWQRRLREKGLTDDYTFKEVERADSRGNRLDNPTKPLDKEIRLATREAIKRVMQKPYCAIGKFKSYSEIRQQLQKEYQRGDHIRYAKR